MEAQLVSPPDLRAGHGFDLPLGTPLCVDLDGTLVKSDTLVDSTLALARQSPAKLLNLPGWLLQGKAALKKHITSAVTLDVAHLPYNRELMQFLEKEHATGRSIYLATAADKVLAERVAEHLDIFTGVFASDGDLNLAGKNKLAAFQSRFGDNFCYIGNASPDVPLLTNCLSPMVANPTSGLAAGLLRANITPVRIFTDETSALKAWLKAIRLHQWAKNILIFLPLLLAHRWNLSLIGGTLVAFLSFGLCASATYIINDLLDIEADRKHIKKRRRPFASGDLSAIKGVIVVGLFLALSFTLAYLLPHLITWIDPSQTLQSPLGFLTWLAVYGVTTSAYSFSLKRMVLVDVIVLSGLYTIRIIAGASATGISISPWLAAFSIFFFLSLAFVKAVRRARRPAPAWCRTGQWPRLPYHGHRTASQLRLRQRVCFRLRADAVHLRPCRSWRGTSFITHTDAFVAAASGIAVVDQPALAACVARRTR